MKYAILAMLILLLAGCERPEIEPNTSAGNSDYPVGATDIQSEGNGWVSFKWKGNCFLTHTNGVYWGNSYDRAFTSYDCPKTAAE